MQQYDWKTFQYTCHDESLFEILDKREKQIWKENVWSFF